ncbi:hypothetical protein DEU56DRAFT_738043, partial [Suillus clintonianus]|uniref:uncharacterized protein n=1 Tax=Suillus clintonianus TaxID=1904413 RepID=UPI001B881FDA
MRPTFSIQSSHIESRTHHLVIRHPRNRRVPVPIGPSLPRRDRPDVKQRYCRLMLILFMPWNAPCDLLRNCSSWSEAFEEFLHVCSPRFHYVMKNMQILHECRDSRD